MIVSLARLWRLQFLTRITSCVPVPGTRRKTNGTFSSAAIASLSLLKSLIFCGKRYFLKQRQLPVPSYPPHGKSHNTIFARSSSQGACDDFGARILFRKFVPPPFAPGSFKTTLLLASYLVFGRAEGVSWFDTEKVDIHIAQLHVRRYRYFFHRLEKNVHFDLYRYLGCKMAALIYHTRRERQHTSRTRQKSVRPEGSSRCFVRLSWFDWHLDTMNGDDMY